MYKFLVIIQLMTHGHSSHVVEFDTAHEANNAIALLKEQKTAYNITILKMY